LVQEEDERKRINELVAEAMLRRLKAYGADEVEQHRVMSTELGPDYPQLLNRPIFDPQVDSNLQLTERYRNLMKKYFDRIDSHWTNGIFDRMERAAKIEEEIAEE